MTINELLERLEKRHHTMERAFLPWNVGLIESVIIDMNKDLITLLKALTNEEPLEP